MQTAIIFQLGEKNAQALASLSAQLAAAGISLRRIALLPADRCPLEAALRQAAAETEVVLVLTLGGTGSAPRDIAPDALSAVLTRPLPGMVAALRAALPPPAAQLFRGQAGLRGNTLLVNLPSPPEAALSAILPGIQFHLAG